jgi:sterol O-acyltransferase
MLMKQHSYAFYNGHLSEVYKRRQCLLHTLKTLQDTVPIQSPSQTSPAVSALSTSYLKHEPSATEINQRRKDSSCNSMESGSEDINQVVAAIESGESLDTEQIQTFERMIKWEVDALAEELQGKSSTSSKSYPNNLTLKNHYEYIVLPTLVYELEYPRTDSIDWSYVLEKTAASVGVLFIMMLVSQTYIYPVVMQTVEMKNQGLPLHQRMRHFPVILCELVLPFMMEYLVWL